ncbi:hypothetical protein [Hyalangium rubrum]|uniref:Uncharacterized protein n=1 Tax=Hyalangium rubrum TaxID=3103134 RepID=A0ABU5H5X4_9BACT|nr:hypothetical protein [Hyalangium sp. s54d21]MDY7228269.1 hypothetical protein [Hyalangium sp. s54d21]
MKYTTRDYLDIVAPHVPQRLIDVNSMNRLAELAATLPPSSNFGFECKLGSPAPTADFLIAVIASDGSRGAWAEEARQARGRRSHPAWEKVQRFLADWERSEGGFEPIYDTWLEFDMDGQDSEEPVPSFFFGFDHTRNDNYPDTTRTMVERLRAAPLPSAGLDTLSACFKELPQRAQVFQIGLMLSRPTDAVRLCIKRLTAEQIATYLSHIGWPGSVAVLQRQLESIAPLVDGMGLDLDIGQSVLPKIGIECSIRDGSDGRDKVKAFLERLSTEGYCTPGKGTAILEWLGLCTERTDRERWPAHLIKASEGLGPEVLSSFARTLNHIKINYESDQEIAAKAYLGVRHYWIRTRAGTS